jgi:hypothetical protein
MTLYTAFGLSIKSDLTMPEFLPGTGPHDVAFRFGTLTPPQCPSDRPARVIVPDGDGILMHWSRIGTFLVEGGTTVTIAAVPGVDQRLLRLILNGPALGVLLFQRGHSVFHASVVASSEFGDAVAVLACKGDGKSTMAAALYNAGYYMMSDDLMALTVKGRDTVIVESGFPHAKLWAESAEALVEGAHALPRLGPYFDKRSRPITERFRETPTRLRAVFVLEKGQNVYTQQLSGFDALQQLLPHWYGVLFDGQLMPILGRERHFKETASLARTAPVYKLVRPWSLDRLPDVVNEVSLILSRDAKG